MMSFEPRVVVIDDKIDEVQGILDQYREEGVGVKYFNANLTEPSPKPTEPLSDLNLIFLDVHFTENASDYDPSHCASWIDSLVSENSFYILVIWSKETDKKDEILEEIGLSNKRPFLCLAEQKTDYQTKDGYNFEVLKEKITKELEEYPDLEELSIWKKSVQNSTNKIIGHLLKNTDLDALRKKLQKIVLGHGGHNLIGGGRESEKRDVLFDALDSILASNSKLTRPNVEISEINKSELYNITNFPKTDVDSQLNSWFHFKLIDPIDPQLLTPGLISYFDNESLKKNYSIQQDIGIKNYLRVQFEGEAENEKPTLEDISVVISRPCDIAQNKFGRNLKLLSGILIKNPIRKSDNKLKTNSAPVSVKVFDHLSVSEEFNDCTMIFDFRYAFSLPPDIFEERFTKFKIFNKELLSEIQVEYSSYSSRLGITQII